MANRNAEVLKILERLAKLEPEDEGLARRAMQIRDRMKLPMNKVLDKVPGTSVAAKAAACGVSRQSFYAWQRGVSRPTGEAAKRLAELTGYPAEDITGKTRLSARSDALAAARAAARTASVA